MLCNALQCDNFILAAYNTDGHYAYSSLSICTHLAHARLQICCTQSCVPSERQCHRPHTHKM